MQLILEIRDFCLSNPSATKATEGLAIDIFDVYVKGCDVLLASQQCQQQHL